MSLSGDELKCVLFSFWCALSKPSKEETGGSQIRPTMGAHNCHISQIDPELGKNQHQQQGEKKPKAKPDLGHLSIGPWIWFFLLFSSLVLVLSLLIKPLNSCSSLSILINLSNHLSIVTTFTSLQHVVLLSLLGTLTTIIYQQTLHMLALPGEVGSWQRECKVVIKITLIFVMSFRMFSSPSSCYMCYLLVSYLGLCFQGYQFWTRADTDGFFTISYIRTGDYNLYAWVPGFIGDYKNDVNITVTEGQNILSIFLEDETYRIIFASIGKAQTSSRLN